CQPTHCQPSACQPTCCACYQFSLAHSIKRLWLHASSSCMDLQSLPRKAGHQPVAAAMLLAACLPERSCSPCLWTALRCAVLCCAVLCCAVLCCAVLCCAMLCWRGGCTAAVPAGGCIVPLGPAACLPAAACAACMCCLPASCCLPLKPQPTCCGLPSIPALLLPVGAGSCCPPRRLSLVCEDARRPAAAQPA
ncbi:hypothetical protein CHLNCDRAFT_28719, partial [Chlorella variabilis]